MQTRLGLVVSGYSYQEIDLEKLPPKFCAELKNRECTVMLALDGKDAVNEKLMAISETDMPEKETENRISESSQQKKGGRDNLEEALRKFMNFECLGVMPEESGDIKMKQKDVDALIMFEKHLTFQNGHYSVGLTFSPDAPEVVDNYSSAHKRLFLWRAG